GPTAYRTAKDGNTYVSVIGSFSPTDVPLGAIWQFTPNGKARAIIKHLRRPTDIAHADFDGDGQEELVIPEFGKLLGRLAVWQRKGTEWFAQVLDPQPGATRVITTDWNEDGHTDILALMAQGDERIVVYLNDGNGQFQGKTLLRFPPSYGSVYLDTLDYNDDGKMDLLYANGDNADYKPILKPYHGVRVYVQSDEGDLQEELFLPLPGAYAAVPADFDLDGDLDIAAISFFPDFTRKPELSFVLFTQNDKGDFTLHPMPATESGRWLRLATADYDNDGDQDLLTTSLAFETVPDGGEVAEWVKNGLPFVFWENTNR
ncbi:MAG: VCBS repeat-containing protein, partial [Bacteroidota bacterium]